MSKNVFIINNYAIEPIVSEEIRALATAATGEILPKRFRSRYEKKFQIFNKWKTEK